MKIDVALLEQLSLHMNGTSAAGKKSGNGDFAAILGEALGEGKGLPLDLEAALQELGFVETEGAWVAGEEQIGDFKDLFLDKPSESFIPGLFTSDAVDEAIPGLFASDAEDEAIPGLFASDAEDEAIPGLFTSDAEDEAIPAWIPEFGGQAGAADAKPVDPVPVEPKSEAGAMKNITDALAEKDSAAKHIFEHLQSGSKDGRDVDLFAQPKEKTAAMQPEALPGGKAAALAIEQELAAGKREIPDWVPQKGAGSTKPGFISAQKADTAAANKIIAEALGAETTGKPESGIKAEQPLKDNSATKLPVFPFAAEHGSEQLAVKDAPVSQARPQTPASLNEQSPVLQQPFLQGEDLTQIGKLSLLPDSQQAALRANVMQQVEGRLVYLRESANFPAEMRMTLNPPELGEITIRVMSKLGKLTASITTETHMAREILESSISELRHRMSIAHIQFEQLDLSTAGRQSDGSQGSGFGNNRGSLPFGQNMRQGQTAATGDEAASGGSPEPVSEGIEFWA